MGTMMKMAPVTLITLLVLSFCSCIASTGSQDPCDLYGTTGGTVSIPFNLKDKVHSLKWYKDNQAIVSKRGDTVNQGNPDVLHANGFLKLTNLTKSSSGVYRLEAHDKDGKVLSGGKPIRLCILVIPNTNKVNPQAPPPVVPEGSDFSLSCSVTLDLTHPTYLSVTWSVKKGATSEEILTVGPQWEVVTGANYAQRFADGGIRLVPGKNGLFKLVISRVTTSDGGTYECNESEWTHEKGGKWIKIAESTKEMGTVAVTPTEPLPGTTPPTNPEAPSALNFWLLIIRAGLDLLLIFFFTVFCIRTARSKQEVRHCK